MDTRVWGPHAWDFLHAVTFAYPTHPTPAERAHMIAFFTHLGPVLPCTTCQAHFEAALARDPVSEHAQSREDLSRWLVRIHNAVNVRLQKPEVPFDHVRIKYEAIRGVCQLSHPGAEVTADAAAPSAASAASTLPSASAAPARHTTAFVVGVAFVAFLLAAVYMSWVCRARRHT